MTKVINLGRSQLKLTERNNKKAVLNKLSQFKEVIPSIVKKKMSRQ